MNLPRGQHPGAASFFELRNALADRFRLEGTAVLKVIDQPRQGEISVLTDFAVADSARKGILHRFVPPAVFVFEHRKKASGTRPETFLMSWATWIRTRN